MNNNDDKDLFDMYGLEHEKDENNSLNNDNNISQEVKDNIPTQIAPEVIDNNEIKPVPNNIIKDENTNNTNTEDELLKLYIGPNYESIINGSYSYCSMLLGPYYFYYRKQYKYALKLFILQVGIVLAYDFLLMGLWYILIFAYAIICFIIGSSFKKNYVTQAKEIIADVNKQNISLDEKKEIIKKMGGVDKKVYILFVSLSMLAYASSIWTLKFFIPTTDLEFHFPEAFKQNTTTNETEYKIGKYEYFDLVVNHRTSDNVCNYKVVVNNEYLGTDKEKMITKYLNDKYSLDNIVLEEAKYEDKEFFHYYDEKSKKDYYIHLSDKYFSEISATYIKDENKKCREYTEYILNHTKKIK